MKKILIIGASGFFGKSLINYFLKKNLFYIYAVSRKLFFLNNQNIKKINLDIKKIKKLPKVDIIYYFINSKNFFLEKKNFFYFKKLLKKLDFKTKILLSSSGAVYGRCSRLIRFKENNKINIRKINSYANYKKKYSLQKIFLENEFKKLGKDGFKVSIARCFTFYGKNILSYDYGISDVINSILKKKNIVFNDQTKVIRSYMHEEDMAHWLYKISKFSNYECPIFNVGSDKIIDLKKFAKELALKYKVKVKFKSNLKKNNDVYLPNISLAKKKLKLNIKKKLKKDIMSFK